MPLSGSFISEEGLKRKYNITKADNTPVDEGFEGFVLRLDVGCEHNHRKACIAALGTYATIIESTLPELAADLRKRYLSNPPVKDSIFGDRDGAFDQT